MKNETDKSKELNTSIILINIKLNFRGTIEGNEPISIDYTPPLGDNQGYTSLELLLLSLSSCVGSAVLTFLRKMRKAISDFQIHSKGIRREDHPTCFKIIYLEIELKSNDVCEDDLNKVLKLSEETYCSVWAMIKGNVDVNVNYKIITLT